MGKASRAKRERRPRPASATTRPRWAGAHGYDRSYFLADLYATTRDNLHAAQATQDRYGEAKAQVTTCQLRRDMLDRQAGTLETALERKGYAIPEWDPDVPSDYPGPPSDFRRYAETLGALADDHLHHIRRATPIVFDPLSVPGVSPEAVDGLGLPFPVVVADFLAPGGMSLPVQAVNAEGWWVGLVAATVSQGEEGGPVDVWPTVMTLHADCADNDQAPTEMMYGRVRFGAPLPTPPSGLEAVEIDGAYTWVVGDTQPLWAHMWVTLPALAAISALRVLDAVNVNLADVTLSRPARRRAEREGARPALTVDITTGRSGTASVGEGKTVDWQHRWMVRGHWKHFGEHTAVARRHPSRIKDVPGHGRCVRVWCPPFVKGPADKPLVLKTRVVAIETEST